jgi:signal transduction histidine kinase/ligand-binding sensor domain-containing protein
MITRFVYYLFVVCLLLSTACPSFSQELMFHPVPPAHHSYSRGVAGVQDPLGYMWLAYDVGLHRYDGYNYISYFNDPFNPNSLASNKVEALCAGRNGIIWAGTQFNGLDRLDPTTGIFTHFRHDPKDAASLSSDSVTAVLEDKEGTIWIGTHGGLNSLNQKTGKFFRYQYNPADSTSLSHNHVRAVYQDRKGTIWVGTGSTFTGDDPVKGGGLNRLDQKNGTFTRYLHDPENPQSLIDNRVRAIFEDSRGTFWVGTAGDGLHTMDRANGTFERHRYDPAHPEKLSRPPENKAHPWADDVITFIIEDVTGAIWIGTFGNGVNRYNPITKKVTYFPNFEDKVSGVKTDVAWWACASRDGVLWIGYWEGLYRIDPLRRSIPYFATGRPVIGISEDTFGVLWYGGNPGLVRKDRTRGTEQQFIYDPRNPLSLSNNDVGYIYEDRKGELWICTEDGLNRFDRKTGTFIRYKQGPFEGITLTNNITSICEDRSGNLWIGAYRGGLNLMNRQTGTFVHYLHNAKDTNSLSNNQITLIYEDRAGSLWIGTELGGLNRLMPQTGRIQRFLSGANVTSLMEDSEGTLWVGTTTGLYRSNPAMNGFSRLSDPGTEVARNIIINGILEDNQTALWIHTSIGILKLNLQRNEVFIYSNYGVAQNFGIGSYRSGYYKAKSGELFFGSANGYFAFYPEQLAGGNTKPPQIVINEFRLANQPVVPGKEGPLKKPLSQTTEIHLNHNQNVFSFDFAGIHFSNPGENRHLFMLENLDSTWRRTGEDKTAYYNNVPPGRYVFRIKAANSDGVWAEKAIAIIINPPWWRTWLAWCFYGVCFLSGIFIIDRYQRKKIINKEHERTRERELQQGREIEKAYNTLKSTQAQLVQSEKMASLGELTAGIAHEIQNPLNFVNNFSEVNTDLIEEMKSELNAGNNADAIAIANDIADNEQKINQHGKRADAIVKGMLQHSRSSTGQKEPTDFNALADEYLRLSYLGMRAKDQSFSAAMQKDFDESIGKINVIPQDIGRVFLNLYNNAFYALNEKKKLQPETYEPTVSVSTKKMNDKVSISVKDNGNGIPQKVVDKIFQPFFTTKPTGQGTGLGLSLSYEFVKAHGGEIKVNTREGEFTEFVVQLPVLL